MDSPYIEKDIDNMFHFDPNRLKIDLFNYKVCNMYSSIVILREEYGKYGINAESSIDRLTLENLGIDSGAGIDKSFREIVQDLKKSTALIRNLKLRDAKLIYPFLPDAINKLDFKRIESLKYSQKAILDELNLISDNSIDFKICRKLGYVTGIFLSNAQIKSDLERAYQSLKLTRTPKAVDIAKFYEVKKSKKRIDGELKEGYTIIYPKYR